MNIATTPIDVPPRKGASVPRPGPSATARASLPEEIRARAYELYVARTGSGIAGDATTDWLRAELELNGAESATPAAKAAGARSRGRAPLVNGE